MWCRPYYIKAIQNDIENNSEIAVGNITNIDYLQYIRKTENPTLFTDSKVNFSNINIKDIESEDYKLYLANCKYYISEGTPSLLADAYYNNKYSIVLTDKLNLNDLTTAMVAQKHKHCQVLFRLNNPIKPHLPFEVNKRCDIRNIDEEIDDILASKNK
jgi:hypothetical protein